MKKITLLIFSFLAFSFGFSQTFTDSGGPYDIQGTAATCGTANALDLPLTVSGIGVLGTTNSIESVTMNITHTFAADLEFSLVDPSGTVTAILMMDNGGGGDNLINTVFSDLGATSITTVVAGDAPFTGTFTPIEPLAAFNTAGINADGDWRLLLCDDAGGDTGMVDDWSITFGPTPSCPSPNGLTANNIGGFSADLSWNAGGTETLWNIELVDITGAGTVTGTPTSTGVTNPFTQIGLVPSNDYEYYVQADCAGNGTSIWIGPFAFSTTVACPDPTALNAINIATSSADLGWTGGAETMWNIELVDITAGGTVTGTATASGVGNPYNQAGLVQNNDYEFYVQADCDPNGTSNWVGPFAFTTACDALAAPYTETFETFTVDPGDFTNENCWSGNISVDGYNWEVADTADASSGGTGPGSGVSNGNYLFTEATGPNAGAITELFSPLVDLTALSTPSVSFDYHMFGVNMGTLEVLVNGNLELSLVGQQQLENDPFITATIDLAAYAGTTIQVTFRGIRGPDFESDIAIDTVIFDEAPTCFTPTGLAVSNITDTSADFNWTAGGSETLWNVELVDITGGGSQTSVATDTGVTSPYNVMGLTPENSYEFYVQADCGVDGVSAWVGPIAFSTPPSPPACNGIFVDSGGSAGGYSANELITTTITPDTPGDAVTITFTYVDIEANATGVGIQDGCWDFLTIYNGPDATSPVLAMTLCGEESGDGSIPSVATSELNISDTFTSTHPSGALTIVFTSDGSVQETGWSADVSCALLSVGEVNANNLFTYYPNPVNNVLSLRGNNQISNVTIMNILGQVVYETSPNTLDSDIDMSSLESAAYLVKVTTTNGTKTVRIIKD